MTKTQTKKDKPKMSKELEKALKNLPLEDYQVKCVDFMAHKKKCGVFLDIGYGKTLATLATIGLVGAKNVLVIAPKAIARTTWHSEIEKWNLPYKYTSFVEAVDEKTGKLKQIQMKDLAPYYELATKTDPKDINVFITTRDRVAHLAGWCLQNWTWPFDFIVCDEFQSFKGGKTTRTKAVTVLADHASRLVGLTGTPMPNSLEDIWSEIRILDKGKRLGRYITQFRNEYMVSTLVINGHAVGWKPRPGASERVFAKIADIAISIKSDIGLPPLKINDIEVNMPEKAMKTYKSMLRDGVLDLLKLTGKAVPKGSETEITAVNAAVLSSKLLQMASGTIYDANHKSHVIHDEKLETLRHIVDNTGGNVLIAYHFRCDVDRIVKALSENSKENIAVFDGSKQMMDAWNKGEYKAMLLQPASCCHGINLQEGGSTLIWYSLPTSLEHYEQTIGRLYRKGQKKPVMVHRLITKDTLDERISNALARKALGNADLLEAVRQEVASVTK